MNLSKTALSKEISEQLDCGFRVFIHKSTEELLFIPDEESLPDIDLDSWKTEKTQLKKNKSQYIEIKKWTSQEAFEIMSEFTEQLDDVNLKTKLFDAFQKPKPFREFKFIIESSGIYRQLWFEYKNSWQQKFVVKQLNQM